VLSPDSTTSDGALLSSARRPGRRGGHHPARPGDEVFGACLGKEVNTLDGRPGLFSPAAPVEGHPAGTLVPVTVSVPNPSRLGWTPVPPAGADGRLCAPLRPHRSPGAAGTGLHRPARQAAPAGSLRRGTPAPGTARARLKIVAAVCTFGSRDHHVVVVGGGFGGLQAVSKLRRAPVEVTLVDRRNFHLFQPLTYQVATGALSPGEIAYPLRAIFKRDRNVRSCSLRSPTSTSTGVSCTYAPSGRCRRLNGSATTR
jgi:hypothetical protein